MERKWISAETAENAAAAAIPGSAFLAGGTEINRLDSLVEADTLISIRRIPELQVIEAGDDEVKIGAACTFQALLEDDRIPAYLKEALSFMASRTKRNMATIGGNIAVCRCDSYLLATLLAADAKLCVMDKGGAVTKTDLSAYVKEPVPGLITAVVIPASIPFIASKRYARTAASHAFLTVSVAKADGAYRVAAAIRNTGVMLFPVLAQMITDDADVTEETLIETIRGCKGVDFKDDMHASANYKQYLLGVTIATMRDKSVKAGA